MSETLTADLLAEKGAYIDTTAGSSMFPMLRHHRDTVTVVPLCGAVKKYDVVLFRRGSQLVLHRVIGFGEDGYRIRGDHCPESEWVKNEQLVGILSAFTRNGKSHTVGSPGYVAYSRIIVWFHPLVCWIMKTKSIVYRWKSNQKKKN